MHILTYLFYPNPGNATYSSPKALLLLGVCAAFVVSSFLVRIWRGRLANPVTKKLSASWPMMLLWFGLISLVLIVSRVESIQFFAMRILWVFWGAALIFYGVFQARRFRQRHYEVLPSIVESDPRAQYLPRKKKR